MEQPGPPKPVETKLPGPDLAKPGAKTPAKQIVRVGLGPPKAGWRAKEAASQKKPAAKKALPKPVKPVTLKKAKAKPEKAHNPPQKSGAGKKKAK